MTTIAQVVQHLRPGGIETMALDLASFCEQDENTFIVSLEGNKDEALEHWPRLQSFSDRLIFLDKKPGLKPMLILQLFKLFKTMDVNVVHTHHIGPLIYAGIAACIAKIKHRIHTEHDAWHLSNYKRCKLVSWILFLTRPTLVADAESVAYKIKHFLKINNIRIIHNGIDTERFTPGDQTQARKNLELPLNVKLIGCSGRMEKVKGQENLIHAMSQLPTSIHLAFAGTGSIEKELREQAAKLGLSKRIHFLGRIDDMPNFYRALDVFCLPSLNEGFPLSPLEAQSCGIPSAVTDVGGSSETLCPNTGELIPADNSDEMVFTLNNMLNSDTPDSNFNPRRFVQKYCDVRLMVHTYTNLRYEGV